MHLQRQISISSTSSSRREKPRLLDLLAYEVEHRRLARHKLSCECCRKSKVKCSRHKPICMRCLKSNKVCVYIKERSKQLKYSLLSELDERILSERKYLNGVQAPFKDFVEYTFAKYPPTLKIYTIDAAACMEEYSTEQICWKLIEQMLLVFRDSKSGFVFYEMILKLEAYKDCLIQMNQTDTLQRFLKFTESILKASPHECVYLTMRELNETLPGCLQGCRYKRKDLLKFRQYKSVLAAYLNVSSPTDLARKLSGFSEEVIVSAETTSSGLLIVVDRNRQDNRFITNFQIFVTAHCRVLFGFTEQKLTEIFKLGVMGCLPLTLPGLVLVCTDLRELFDVLQIEAAKCFNVDITKGPILNETKSIHILTLNVYNGNSKTVKVKKKFLVETVLRQLTSFTALHDEIYYKFVPLDEM